MCYGNLKCLHSYYFSAGKKGNRRPPIVQNRPPPPPPQPAAPVAVPAVNSLPPTPVVAEERQSRPPPPRAEARGPQFVGGSGGRNHVRSQREQFGEDDRIGNDPSENDSARYNFAYEVNSDESGAQYSHSENAENGVISGEYRVNLPDGRVQIVR